MALNKQYQDQLPNQNILSNWNKRIWELFIQLHWKSVVIILKNKMTKHSAIILW